MTSPCDLLVCLCSRVSEGELVWCDLSAIYRDYCSDMSSFVVVGGATEAHRKFIDIARDVHLGMVDFIRPGLRSCDVMHHVKESYRKTGLDWNFDIGRCGHGIGLELAEQPSLDDNSTVVLEPGMTLALEPAVLTHNGVYDMEEDVLVTEGARACLAALGRRGPPPAAMLIPFRAMPSPVKTLSTWSPEKKMSAQTCEWRG